jgi:hypothetical protein
LKLGLEGVVEVPKVVTKSSHPEKNKIMGSVFNAGYQGVKWLSDYWSGKVAVQPEDRRVCY